MKKGKEYKGRIFINEMKGLMPRSGVILVYIFHASQIGIFLSNLAIISQAISKSIFQGFYMYAEASNCPSGSRVRTKSIKFAATTARCLTLFYNINGESTKGFNIYVSKSSGEEKIFSEIKNLGNVWKGMKKTFSSKGSDYWVRRMFLDIA